MKIDKFRGKYGFLSNFCMSPLWYDGILYPSSEHAYQAAKADSYPEKEKIARLKTPAETKRYAKTFTHRDGFHNVKTRIMFEIVLRKFVSNSFLTDKLLSTGDAELIEGNTWHDNFWGNCTCDRKDCSIEGKNNLGRILMEVRRILKGP